MKKIEAIISHGEPFCLSKAHLKLRGSRRLANCLGRSKLLAINVFITVVTQDKSQTGVPVRGATNETPGICLRWVRHG